MRALNARIFLATLFLPGLLHAAPSPLTVRFSERAITVEGATAGGNVVYFGLARELTATATPVRTLVRYAEVIADGDRDGTVRLEFASGVPAIGMWAVVDLSTGRHAAIPTPGYDPVRLDFTPQLLKKDNAGQLRKLQWPLAEMDVLLVRPGEGAWRIHAAKHSARDENRGKQDVLRLDVEAMTAIGNSPPPPKHIKNGDVLAVMDPRWMQYGILEAGK